MILLLTKQMQESVLTFYMFVVLTNCIDNKLQHYTEKPNV